MIRTKSIYKINQYSLNTRAKHYKKHVTPALELKETGGIKRNNLTTSNEYMKLYSDKYSKHPVYQPTKVKSKKKRFH